MFVSILIIIYYNYMYRKNICWNNKKLVAIWQTRKTFFRVSSNNYFFNKCPVIGTLILLRSYIFRYSS